MKLDVSLCMIGDERRGCEPGFESISYSGGTLPPACHVDA